MTTPPPALPVYQGKLESWLNDFGATKIQSIEDHFKYFPSFYQAHLGSGAYGDTYRVTSSTDTSSPHRVMKVIGKDRITRAQHQVDHFACELATLTLLDSPRLNKAVSILHDDEKVYLVLEMCPHEPTSFRTRLYHIAAMHSPHRMGELEAIIAEAESQWEQAKARNPQQDQHQFFEARLQMAQVQLKMWVKEAPPMCDLFRLINGRKKPVSERVAAIIVKQCLEGVASLHARNIVHRDVKTENIVLAVTRTSEPIFKEVDGKRLLTGVRFKEVIHVNLIDFGLCKYMRLPANATCVEDFRKALACSSPDEPWTIPSSPVGTELFFPLELINQVIETGDARFDASSTELPKADIYCCGVTHFCLTQKNIPYSLPKFKEHSRKRRIECIRHQIEGGMQFPSTVTEPAKDFIQWLMGNDPNTRPTVEEALSSDYLRGITDTYIYEVDLAGNVVEIPTASPVMDTGSPVSEDERPTDSNGASPVHDHDEVPVLVNSVVRIGSDDNDDVAEDVQAYDSEEEEDTANSDVSADESADGDDTALIGDTIGAIPLETAMTMTVHSLRRGDSGE